MDCITIHVYCVCKKGNLYRSRGENMQTTGTVLLNARGVNINGYDCFVNLSKDSKDMGLTIYHGDAEDSPFTSYPILDGVDSSNIKISPCSLVYSNHYKNCISFPYSISCTSFTAAVWAKSVCFNDSYATSKNYWNSAKVQIRVDQIYGCNCGVPNKFIELTDNRKASAYAGINTSQTLDTNWHHYALVVSGSTARWYIDGILKKTITAQVSAYNITQIWLSSHFSYQYFDDLVLIANQAIWSSNFTPPSTYLLDSEYAMDLDQVKRKNIIAANVNKKLIIPDEETLKQY